MKVNTRGPRVFSDGGPRVFPDGSAFVPSENPVVAGYRLNSSDWESWGKTTRATVLVGLKTGRKTGRFPRVGTVLTERLIYEMTFGVRVYQVGIAYGSSFIRQYGHYIPSGTHSIGPEEKYRERSIQIVVFPAPDESWTLFRKNIRELANRYIEELAQVDGVFQLLAQPENLSDVG